MFPQFSYLNRASRSLAKTGYFLVLFSVLACVIFWAWFLCRFRVPFGPHFGPQEGPQGGPKEAIKWVPRRVRIEMRFLTLLRSPGVPKT